MFNRAKMELLKSTKLLGTEALIEALCKQMKQHQEVRHHVIKRSQLLSWITVAERSEAPD